MSGWALAEWLCLDLETNGLGEGARLVSAAVVWMRLGREIDTRTWLADAGGEEIPREAAELHGISTARAHRFGRPALRVALEVAEVLADAVAGGMPIVAFHAPFDLTIVDRELGRGGQQLPSFIGGSAMVLDPPVIDRAADPHHTRSRSLRSLADWYLVRHERPHEALSDASAAGQVMYQIAGAFPEVRDTDLVTLVGRQRRWAAEQAQARVRGGGKAGPAGWPLIPRQQDGDAR
ncbi:exonuclease domain-containing protein [Kitasatospora phosalacinea]|uniref:Exonuclease domain-containing protein n=1 Tax=Kitasatospora phosalacinea TaxID=2065 RepID=A0ABW6GRM9_9ACTN